MALKQRVQNKIDDALGLASVPFAMTPEIVPTEIISTGNADEDMQSDLAAARRALHILAEKGADLFDKAAHFASERQDARSVEAAVQAQKEARDSIIAVIEFHKTRKEIERVSNSGGKGGGDTTINQTVFCGTATELLQMMKEMKEMKDGPAKIDEGAR